MADITHARVWAISWPIILSNITVPLLGAVDTAMVGQLGQAAPIGAVGLGAIILSSLYWIFGFLRMGTSGLAAQAHGRGQGDERAAILYRALIIGFAAGFAIMALQVALFWAAFRMAPASDAVEGLAQHYLEIRIWGAPATIALYAINGWLIAIERTRAVLMLQLWINGVNALLDFWFVLGLGWGVGGVATATLIAEWSGLFLGLYLCRDAFGAIRRAALARLAERAALRQMLVVNSSIMLRSVLLQGAFTSFLFLSAGLGDQALAANQVLLQFMSISAYAMDGFAFAAETLVGQAVGAKAGREVDRAVKLSLQWGFGGSLLVAMAFWLGGPLIVARITTAPDVQQVAGLLLPWVIAAPVISVAGYMWDGIFIGATASRAMLQIMIVAGAVYAICIILLPMLWGNHGLWAALLAMNLCRGIVGYGLWPGVRAKALS